MENMTNAREIEELLPWHRPELQQLRVTLDTGFFLGSNTDGAEGELREF